MIPCYVLVLDFDFSEHLFVFNNSDSLTRKSLQLFFKEKKRPKDILKQEAVAENVQGYCTYHSSIYPKVLVKKISDIFSLANYHTVP